MQPLPVPADDHAFLAASASSGGFIGTIDGLARDVLPLQNCDYVLTAGADRKIRCWDLLKVERSYVLAGQNADPQPKYRYGIMPRHTHTHTAFLADKLTHVPLVPIG